MRCVHEASIYDENCFVTLTYDEDHCPSNGSLVLRDYQLFMKRLRKKFGAGIRFYHCGEYGEKTGRPHYHALLFNFDFPDKYLWKIERENRLYRSDALEQLWPMGNSMLGDVTFESAAYVARYIMKKVTGKNSDYHYTTYDPETGEVIEELKPEYTTMSRRPGIGSVWFEKYKDDVYRIGKEESELVVRGVKMKPPKYYDGLYELANSRGYRRVRSKRKRESKKHADNNTPERLRVREKVAEARVEMMKRTLEEN